MAIEIGSQKEKEEQLPLLNVFFYAGIALLVLSAGSYFYINNYLNVKASEDLQAVKSAIDEKNTPEFKALEKEISTWDKKIKDYNLLFSSHGQPSNIFALLEKLTHPKVWWKDFAFESISLNTVSSVKLTGTADSFISLQQQILILEKENFVKKINLSRVSLSKTGQVDFGLEVSLYPGILNPVEEETSK